MTSNSNLSYTLPHLYYPQHEPLQLACPTSTNTTHSINTLAPLDASFTVSNHLHSTHLSPTHIEPIAQLLPSSLPLSLNRSIRSQHSLPSSPNTSTRPPRRRHAGALPSRLHHTPRPQPSSGHGICAHLLLISTHSHLIDTRSHSQPSRSHLIDTRRHAATHANQLHTPLPLAARTRCMSYHLHTPRVTPALAIHAPQRSPSQNHAPRVALHPGEHPHHPPVQIRHALARLHIHQPNTPHVNPSPPRTALHVSTLARQ